ncbi:hypothetical protein V6N12_019762 [Hibiscus sabdariffa]|uniref:Uncharacterized protein n=1 Tax=Hibiscus sabdariffa TaxID=183260 RepID=A0ABR2AZG9_9ROSI
MVGELSREAGEQQIGKQQAGKKQQQAGEQQIDEQRLGDKQQVREQQTRDQRKQQTAEQEHEREKQSISVFVENIPNAMHWKENSVSVEKSGDKILESREFIKSDNLGEAKIIKKSAWNSNSDSSPIAEKRSECGESAGNNFLGNSESNKLVGSGNISLEKNNLDGEESNRQFDEKSTSQFGKEYIQDKVNKRSWAAVVAKSGPDLLLETGGSQVQNDKESVNPISPNKVVTAPNNWDMPHSASSGGSIHGSSTFLELSLHLVGLLDETNWWYVPVRSFSSISKPTAG